MSTATMPFRHALTPPRRHFPLPDMDWHMCAAPVGDAHRRNAPTDEQPYALDHGVILWWIILCRSRRVWRWWWWWRRRWRRGWWERSAAPGAAERHEVRSGDSEDRRPGHAYRTRDSSLNTGQIDARAVSPAACSCVAGPGSLRGRGRGVCDRRRVRAGRRFRDRAGGRGREVSGVRSRRSEGGRCARQGVEAGGWARAERRACQPGP